MRFGNCTWMSFSWSEECGYFCPLSCESHIESRLILNLAFIFHRVILLQSVLQFSTGVVVDSHIKCRLILNMAFIFHRVILLQFCNFLLVLYLNSRQIYQKWLRQPWWEILTSRNLSLKTFSKCSAMTFIDPLSDLLYKHEFLAKEMHWNHLKKCFGTKLSERTEMHQ